jgi:polyisoprenoid-binding protein YceI
MKSFMSHMAGVAKTRRLSILSIVMLGVISPLAFADGETWSLDSTTSSARFFHGSTADADSVNRGVARVSGRVKLDANDLGKSDFDFSIYPANEQWGQALSPEGALPAGFVPDTTDHALLTFHSKRVRRMGDGKLEVTGDLTVTRVERSVTLTPSEGFAGPVYGDPVIHRETREIEFLFPSLSAAVSSDLLTSVALQKNGKEFFDLAGTARLGDEDFVELLSATQDSNWPSVVQNERCDMPSGVGEDYHGATCTGTVIAATHPDNCEMPAVVGGEGYSGAVCTPASGNQTTIELDLKMHRMNSGGVSEMPLGSGATR